MAESGCLNTAQALMPAVQNLVKKLGQHPDFATPRAGEVVR